jgi:hypothetical protein
MRAVRNGEWQAFVDTDVAALGGQRIKHVRHETLKPGGRTELTLFEQVESEGRPHPRLQVQMPPATDPRGDEPLFTPPSDVPSDDAAVEVALQAALKEASATLSGEELDDADAPAGSKAFWRASITGQRKARFFTEAAAWASTAGVDAAYSLASLADLAFSGPQPFDDHDTGTYHSFGKDAPFVHYLESVLSAVPQDGEGVAILPSEQQESVRRQRAQATAHLDFLMRHKYAFKAIKEMDIERSLGGFLICKETRQIASETPESRDSLAPSFELLRVQPGSDHPKAGTWLRRVGDELHDEHGLVEGVEDALRRIPRSAEMLTFRRAPDDPKLREGVRFDWDGNGWVAKDKIGWISWAGHCDIKAVVEQLGITFSGDPRVREWRSDSAEDTDYSRDLLLEAFTSVLELGSVYNSLDGGGAYQRGIHRFGGSRNDSRPDRLQFMGPGEGRHFRWPLGGRQDSFVVTGIAFTDGDADMKTVFQRCHKTADVLDFEPNPKYLRTVEGDYNLIAVQGATLSVRLKLHGFDPATGHLSETGEETSIDLGDTTARSFLGTHLDDAAKRRLYRVYWDAAQSQIVAELEEWQKLDGRYAAVRLEDEDVRLPIITPLDVTLSHEMRRDDPRVFTELVNIAMRQGQNINADTDMKAEVWNGTVTHLSTERLGQDRERRTEHWKVKVAARFGNAAYEFLLRRDKSGAVVDTCSIVTRGMAPDFLWQDWPDVGTKGVLEGDWIVNRSMVDRGIVRVETDHSAPGGYYVFDDHMKNVYELCYCGFAGYRWTIVHGNKRFGFQDEAAWTAAVDALKAARAGVTFEA